MPVEGELDDICAVVAEGGCARLQCQQQSAPTKKHTVCRPVMQGTMVCSVVASGTMQIYPRVNWKPGFVRLRGA